MFKVAVIVVAVIALLAAAYDVRWVVPMAREGAILLERDHVERVCLMLLKHRREYGSFPKQLEDASEFDESCQFADVWGTPLRYKSDGKTFLVVSAGPDRTFDTEDDVSAQLRRTDEGFDSSRVDSAP